MRFAGLFLLWSLIEIGLFVTLGGWIGLWATWGVVLGSGVLGVMLIRWQKRTAVGQVIHDLQTLGDPLTPAAHSVMIVVAGLLLILPGILTDALGLLLLIPWVLDYGIARLRDRARLAATDRAVAAMLRPRHRSHDVIDGQAEEVHPASPRPHKPSGWTKP